MKSRVALASVLFACLLATSGCGRSPEQEAIAAIERSGGKIRTDAQGRVDEIDLNNTAATDQALAAASIFPTVHTIICTNAKRINGAGLAPLGNLPNLHTLYLGGTNLDDAGLAKVRALRNLRTLHLGRTKITDEGMPALADLTNLKTLILTETEITDAGLVQLRNLRDLSTLVLKGTKTTQNGLQELRRMLPNARIDD